MIGVYVMLGGMVLFATVLGVIELLTRPRDRRQHKG